MSKIGDFFGALWFRVTSVFKIFMKSAIDQSTALLISQFSSIAQAVVGQLAGMDLSNDEKRKEAFNKIKAEILRQGKIAGDVQINLLVELAVSSWKNSTSK